MSCLRFRFRILIRNAPKPGAAFEGMFDCEDASEARLAKHGPVKVPAGAVICGLGRDGVAMRSLMRTVRSAAPIGASFLLIGGFTVLKEAGGTAINANERYRGTQTPLPAGGFTVDLQEPFVFPVFVVPSDDGRVGVECGSGRVRLDRRDVAWMDLEETGHTITSAVPGGLAFLFQTTGGFTDSTRVRPVGGNPGTTLGEQRSIALQYAAGIWGEALQGTIPISVEVGFRPGSDFPLCYAGFALIQFVFRDFSGAPRPQTFYFEPLANTLAGQDLQAGADFQIRFNSDFPNCRGVDFYYGLDGNPPPYHLDFVSLALHEIGHGLGFAAPFVVYQNGSKLLGFDDAYTANLEDHVTGEIFPDMIDAERLAASTGAGELHWVGDAVISGAGGLIGGVHPSGHVEMQTVIPTSPSIDHFGISLYPNELMEPSLDGPIHDPGLAVNLLVDLGWTRTPTTPNPIPGTTGMIKPGSLIRGLHRGSFTLPTSVTGASISVTDTAGAGGAFLSTLKLGSWSGLGVPPGSKGLRFRGSPCNVVIKKDVIKYECKSTGSLTTPLTGDMSVTLNVGGQQYCATFGGTIVSNDGRSFKAKAAPAPSSCPTP